MGQVLVLRTRRRGYDPNDWVWREIQVFLCGCPHREIWAARMDEAVEYVRRHFENPNPNLVLGWALAYAYLCNWMAEEHVLPESPRERTPEIQAALRHAITFAAQYVARLNGDTGIRHFFRRALSVCGLVEPPQTLQDYCSLISQAPRYLFIWADTMRA